MLVKELPIKSNLNTIKRTWVMDNGDDIAHMILTYSVEPDGPRLHLIACVGITYFDEDVNLRRKQPTPDDLVAAERAYPASLGQQECEWTEDVLPIEMRGSENDGGSREG